MKSIRNYLFTGAAILSLFFVVSLGLGIGIQTIDFMTSPRAHLEKISKIFTEMQPVKSVRAGALTDYGENKLVDALLRAQAIGTPATWYIALFTDTCTDAGPGTEVSTSGTAYGRQAVTAALANWAGTQSAGSTTASSGTGGTTSNNNVIAWSASTAAWGNIQSVGWMDASSAGNRWICINLTSALNVSGAGFTVSFAAGQLTFQIDN